MGTTSFFWKMIGGLIRLVRRLARYSESRCIIAGLKSCGVDFQLEFGARFTHPEFVEIGDAVTINSHAWVNVVPLAEKGGAPSLKIGDGTYIGRFASISCMDRIDIGEDVLIADRVFISDHLHGYKDITLPVSQQPLFSPGAVEIGNGSWVGVGVSILPNVKIGKNCVIGANAVVTRDVPDYHVAVGIPARIIGRVDRLKASGY